MMETDSLLSINEHHQSLTSSKRLPVKIMATIWFLGAINLPIKATGKLNSVRTLSDAHSKDGTSRWVRQFFSMSSIIFIVLLNAASVLTVAFYLICYFGKTDHYLRFVSFTCYWPSIMSTQIVCLIASISLTQRDPTHDERGSDITWVDLFNEKLFSANLSHFVLSKKEPLPKKSVFVFFYSFALFVSSIRVVFLLHFLKKCPNGLEYVFFFNDIFGLIFYGTFCYYLYLRRIILEENCKETAQFIRSNVGKLDPCIGKVRDFFRDYFQLRKLLLPWLGFVVFSSTFGVTVFFTWNYNKHISKETNITSPESNHLFANISYVQSICAYQCDTVEFLEKGNKFLLYNIFVLSRHILTGILPLVAVRRTDVKYIWDRLRMKINYMYAKNDQDFWNSLIKFMDKLHPSSTADLILAFVLPLMAFAYGLLGGREEDF